MPAPPLSNTLEGGTDTTIITTGNSGGASGNAFSTVTLDTGAGVSFSATHAAHGALGMQITTDATPAACRVDWTGLGGGTGNVWFRTYLYRTANPSAAYIFGGVRDSGALLSAQIRVTTGGLVRVEDPTPAFVVALDGATAMSLNQWVRFEWRTKSAGAGASEFEWWLYNTPDAPIGSHTETKAATGITLGANTDQIRFGMVTNAIASDTSWFDDLAVSTTGPLGPASLPPEPPRYSRPVFPMLRKFRPIRFPIQPWPLPSIEFPPSDVTVVAGAATALGVTPQPVVDVVVPQTSSVALGSSPTPVVNVVRPATAALALGLTPAPTPLVVVPVTSAIALGITPAPTVVIGAADVTVTPGPAIALGVTPAPLVLVTVPITSAVGLGVTPAPAKLVTVVSTAALALGVTPAPTKLVVVFPTAALALGVTPAPTVVIPGNVTVTPSAALALGVTPQPTVLVVVAQTASVALGVAPAATPGKSLQVGASLALGAAPTAAVRVVVFPLPALGLGVAPSPTAIAGTGFIFRPYSSRQRGRIDVRVNGNIDANQAGRVFARSQDRELTSATGGRMGSE